MDAAVAWISSLLLGGLGTTIAVIAVAIGGFRMLTGRLMIRDGTRIIMGCFILFGAPFIARGLLGAAPPPEPSSQIAASPRPKAPSLPSSLPAARNNPFDPYAGGGSAK